MIMTHPQVEYWATEGGGYIIYRGRIPHGGMGRSAVLHYNTHTGILFAEGRLMDVIPYQRVAPDNLDLTVAALFAIHNDAIAEAIAAG